MSWTVFVYTARDSEFKASDAAYLVIFVDAGMNKSLQQVTEILKKNPLHHGYEVAVGVTQDQAWTRVCNRYCEGSHISLQKVLKLQQTLVVKQDKRFSTGYRTSAGSY